MLAGTVTPLHLLSNNPTDVDELPHYNVKIEPAFSELEIKRPIILTHAGDGTNRVFICSQLGKIYVLPNDQQAKDPKIFMDFEPKVTYKDNENEEGLLGMAFHPKFKENGQFFLFYTTREAPHTSVISRFTVSKDNPNEALPGSEEVILKFDPKPFWNHNGGTLAFGPDGYLYIALGDGGSANDPHKNGQNLKTLLGSILRIDVDKRDEGKKYAIPKDNPFVGKSDAAPEIYAYGVRNIWRLAFDKEKGTLWAADVGQNIWEEINIVRRGDNLGWNPRESMHRFQADGSGPKADFVEPIWEYHHDLGKSITGGFVYRGTRVPELVGSYLYADYVTGRVWALKYDESARKVVSNKPILGNIAPVMSFGEDEKGDIYFLTVNGRMFRFASAKE
jgi:glucose/arabinose dehydrogenase